MARGPQRVSESTYGAVPPPPANIVPGKWYKVRVEVRAGVVTSYLDDKQVAMTELGEAPLEFDPKALARASFRNVRRTLGASAP